MKVYFHTLGCKVNHYETEAMQKIFTAAGHETAGNAAKVNPNAVLVTVAIFRYEMS